MSRSSRLTVGVVTPSNIHLARCHFGRPKLYLFFTFSLPIFQFVPVNPFFAGFDGIRAGSVVTHQPAVCAATLVQPPLHTHLPGRKTLPKLYLFFTAFQFSPGKPLRTGYERVLPATTGDRKLNFHDLISCVWLTPFSAGRGLPALPAGGAARPESSRCHWTIIGPKTPRFSSGPPRLARFGTIWHHFSARAGKGHSQGRGISPL